MKMQTGNDLYSKQLEVMNIHKDNQDKKKVTSNNLL